MTNPNNAVGTNAAYGGRTSTNAFNDCLASYTRGVMSGWACLPSSGLTVSLGGDGTTRDVAVAEDNAGNKTSINNISGSPISVTMSAAPGANSRIDAIVAYVDNPPQGTSTIADNYEACGIIPVTGTAAADPTAPSDGAIRSAITADGASGTTAYYVVLAYIVLTSGTTDITSDNITIGQQAELGETNVDLSSFGFGNYSTTETSTGFTWVDGRTIYKKTVEVSSISSNTDYQIPHGISNLKQVIRVEGTVLLTIGNSRIFSGGTSSHVWRIGNISSTDIGVYSTLATAGTYYFTLYYTKS